MRDYVSEQEALQRKDQFVQSGIILIVAILNKRVIVLRNQHLPQLTAQLLLPLSYRLGSHDAPLLGCTM